MNTLFYGISSCLPSVHSLQHHCISFLKFRTHLMLPIKRWREDSSAWQMVLTARHLRLPLLPHFQSLFSSTPAPIHPMVFPWYAISLHLPIAFIQNDLTSSLLIILVFTSYSNSKYLLSQMSSHLRKKILPAGFFYGPDKINFSFFLLFPFYYMVLPIFKICYILSNLFNC